MRFGRQKRSGTARVANSNSAPQLSWARAQWRRGRLPKSLVRLGGYPFGGNHESFFCAPNLCPSTLMTTWALTTHHPIQRTNGRLLINLS